MPKAFGLIAALLALASVSVHAQAPAPQTLPPIVQRYIAAVQAHPRLAATAAQQSTSDVGYIRLAPGNKAAIVSKDKDTAIALVCNGVKVTEWNSKQIAKAKAPKSLDQLDPPLPLGASAAIAFGLLTDSTSITDYANLTDMGIVTVSGVPAHKVVSIEDGDTATFWLDDKTALPVQVAYTGGRHDRTIVIRCYPTAADPYHVFTAHPPAHLALFIPKPVPKLLRAGTSAPDFTLPLVRDADGKSGPLTLSQLRGQVVLLDFWAAWCRPCKKTMPHIQALRQRLGPRGLMVLSVNTWDSKPRMAAFVRAHPQYTSTFLFDARPYASSLAVTRYHVSGIPTVYIIDKEGHIAGAFNGDDPHAAADIEATLAKLGRS